MNAQTGAHLAAQRLPATTAAAVRRIADDTERAGGIDILTSRTGVTDTELRTSGLFRVRSDGHVSLTEWGVEVQTALRHIDAQQQTDQLAPLLRLLDEARTHGLTGPMLAALIREAQRVGVPGGTISDRLAIPLRQVYAGGSPDGPVRV